MTAPRSVVVHSPSRCVDGLRIAMRVQGEGDPLLLINGMTRPLQSWEQLTRALPGRTIITFDSPWSRGQSDTIATAVNAWARCTGDSGP